MVDVDTVEQVAEPWTIEGLLLGFLTHDHVFAWNYGDEGPEDGVEKVSSWTGGEWPVGWAVAREADSSNAMSSHEVYLASSDGAVLETAVWATQFEAGLERWSRESREVGDDEGAARARDDVLASLVAAELNTDICVTRRPYLLRSAWLARNVTFCEPEAALALVTLYLRAQGEFFVYKDARSSSRVNRGLYYWIAAREAVPESWRWVAACAQHSSGEGSDEPIYLAQAALDRVARAFQIRDQIHILANRQQDLDIADQTLLNLDTLLFLLMGAFDAAAGVAHLSTGGELRTIRRAAWQRDWLQHVSRVSPNLARLVWPGAPGHYLLTILGHLRNAVHGPGLPPLAVGQARVHEQTLFGLPQSKSTEIAVALDNLGGQDVWGVKAVIPGRFHADPATFVEQMLPKALGLLDEIMRETPVDRLTTVHLSPADCEPPDEAGFPGGAWSERGRWSILRQLALGFPP